MADAAIQGHEHDERGFFTRWFMSTNHKDIGILYLFTAGLMGLVSVCFTVYMRLELMEPGVQYMCLEGARLTAAAVADCTPNGHLWAAPFETNGEFGHAIPTPDTGLARHHISAKAAAMMAHLERANTTIAIVATDAGLTKAQWQRMAITAHDGITRAIVPAHTPMDGDLVFALSTNDPDPTADLSAIGHAAALCLTRAIGRAVTHATPAPHDLLECWRAPSAG